MFVTGEIKRRAAQMTNRGARAQQRATKAKTFCWPTLYTTRCVCVRVFVSTVCVHYWLLLGYKDFSTTFRNK